MDIRPLKQDFYNQLIIGKPQVLQKIVVMELYQLLSTILYMLYLCEVI